VHLRGQPGPGRPRPGPEHGGPAVRPGHAQEPGRGVARGDGRRQRAGQAALPVRPGAAARAPDAGLGPAAPGVAVRQDRGVDPAGHARRRPRGRRRTRLRRDRLPAGRHPGVVRRRGAPARQRGAARQPAPHRGAPGRGVRRARGRAALPRAAAVVHRGPGAERPHRDPGDVRRGRPGGDYGPGLGPGPGHDQLRHGRRREHARPRPPAAAGAADQPRLARGAAVRRRRHGILRRHRARGGGRDRGRRRPLLDRDRHRGRRVGRGDFGRQPVRKGQTFAWPASLSLRLCAGRAPVRIVRCLGPREA